jgi:hypothetical protein
MLSLDDGVEIDGHAEILSLAASDAIGQRGQLETI